MNKPMKNIFAPIGWLIIGLISLAIILILLILVFMPPIGVDMFFGTRPYDYPYTIWTSENPDIYFRVYQTYDEINGQITIDGIAPDLRISFDHGGRISFYDVLSRDPESGGFPFRAWLFQGSCVFGEHELIVTITDNKKSFLDDTVKEIRFVRVDMEKDNG